MFKKLKKKLLKQSNKNNFNNLISAFIGLSFAYTVSILPVYSQQITIDGKTNTTLNFVNTTTTNITTSTVKNNNAFNSFQNFNVYSGKIVNLVVPQNASCLINLVNSSSSRIDGMLNSISNGRIGGNIFLINPHGITIGAQGTINVGSLTALTPTSSFVNGVISPLGEIDDALVSALLNGTTPISPNGKILVNGTINSIGNVTLDAGEIIHTGQINAGPSSKEAIVDAEDLLNLDKISDQDNLAYDSNSGYISLKASGDVIVQGSIKSDGYTNVDAGNISITSGNNIELQENSLISAKGVNENSNAGDIYIYADNKATFEKGAIIDARGGNVSGDGGFIELSAGNNVTLEGGNFKAKSINGRSGEVLIDPDTIDVMVDNLSDGVDITYVADINIMVDSGVTISSRNIVDPDAGNHLLDASEGDSGNISFIAPEIEIKPGARILSFADGESIGGDITFTATSIGETDAEALIKIDSNSVTPTILKGNNISLIANAQDTYNASFDDILTPAANANASAYIGSYAQVTASNNITIDANSYAESKLIILTLPISEFNEDISADAKPVSTAYIGEYSNVTAQGNININAKAEADSFVETIFFTPPANTVPEAEAYIGNNAIVSSNAGEININSEAIADSYALKTAKPSGAFSKTDVMLGGAFSKSNATPEANSYIANSAIVSANDPNAGNINIVSSTTAISKAQSYAVSLSTEDATAGVTVPIANSIPFSTSYIGDNTNITAGHNLSLSSLNIAEANAIGVYGTLATNDKGIGGSIAISNTTTDTTLGDVVSAVLGGLIAAPGAITQCLKENEFKDYHSKSYIGKNSTITAGLNIEVSASDDFTADADASAVAGAGKFGAAGAVAYSDSNPVTVASINQGSNVTSTSGQIQIITDSKANSSTNADAGAISAQGGGVGATVSLAKARPESSAFVGEDVTLNAINNSSGDIILSSKGDAVTDVLSVAGAGAGGFAGGASVGIADSNPLVSSYTSQGSVLNAGHDIYLLSFDKSESGSLSIFGALASSTGAGATNATSLIGSEGSFVSNAYVGNGSTINAGNDLFIQTNTDEDDYDSKAMAQSVAGALGGTLGLAGSSSDSLVNSKTSASIADGANVTAGNINISARNKSEALASADSGAVGADGGIGAAVTVSQAKPISIVSIGKNAQVNAVNDIDMTSVTQTTAKYADNVTTFNTIAGAGGGAFAGGASVAISEAVPQSEVFIDTGSNVTAGNDIKLIAKEKTIVLSRSGFAAIGGTAAIGASVATTKTNNDGILNTSAYIATGATVTANSNIEIKTNPDALEDDPSSVANSHAIAGTGGGTLALAGSIATANSNSASAASIEEGATVSSTSGDIIINSNNISKALSSADSGAVSLQGGISAAVSTATSTPVSKAYIGKNAIVTASNDIEIKSSAKGSISYSNDVTKTNALAGAGGGYFALGGAVSNNNINNNTLAFVDEGASVTANGNLSVLVDSNFSSNAVAGNVVGGFVGLGASIVNMTDNSITKAFIAKDAEIIIDQDVNISAHSEDNSVSKAYAGQGGIVSLGSSVVIATSDKQTKAYVDSESKIGKADNLNIKASNKSNVETKSYGLSVGGVAAGASYAESVSGGSTQAYIANAGEVGILSGQGNVVNNVNIESVSDNTAKAYSKAGSVGVYSGSGAVSIATTTPSVDTYIGEGAQVTTDGDINIKSQVIDAAEAESIGVSVGGASVGVSWSEAELKPTINTYIGDDANINAAGNISLLTLHNYSDRYTKTDNEAYAYSLGASGGALLGANASYSKSQVNSVTNSYFGSNANIDGDDIEIITISSNKADNKATGVGAGFVAAGVSISKAFADSDNASYVGLNTNINANNIVLSSYTDNLVYAKSVAGSGGVIAGSASLSETNVDTTTKAYLVGNDQESNSKIVSNNNIDVLSHTKTRYKAISDSTNASVVGASGARVENDIESSSKSYMGKNTNVDAGNNINIKATNAASRYGSGYDLKAGAGGFAGGPAGKVDTDIDLTSKAYVSGNDIKDVTKSIHADNDIKIDSSNDVYTNESAKLKAGGAISWATIEVDTSNDNVAHSYIGKNTIVSAGNDLYVATRSESEVNTEAKADSYGVAGVAKAYTESKIDSSNVSEVFGGAEVFAGRNINIFAGKSSDGYLNNLEADADSRAWASGGIPITRVGATAEVDNDNNVKIHSDSYLLSSGNITLTSKKGSYDADAYAKGKMKTYLLFGIPITFTTDGSRDSDTDSSANISLDGYIRSGLGSQRYLYIKRDGSIANFSELIDFKENELAGTNVEEIDKIARLEAEIKYLKELNDLNALTSTNIEDIVYLQAQPDTLFNPRNYLNERKAALEQTLIDDIALLTPEEISSITDNINDIDRQLANYDGKLDAEIEIITVPVDDILVSSGKIDINGSLSGSGSINAPGNHFSVGFLNDSIKNVTFKNIEIEKNVDGRIKINNSTRTSNYGNITVNPGSTARKRIEVFNMFDPNDPRNPAELADKKSELLFTGDILNVNGDVKIQNNSGNIVTYGLIKADTIEITGNADFIHNYTPGIYDTAGTTYGDNPVAGMPTIMAGNIIISAERININGLLQSGIDEYTLVIDEDFDPNTDLYNEGSATNLIKTDNSNLKAYWDGEKIQVYRAETKGGYIELNGEIISTGNGKLRVLDGYGTINIVNNSDKDIVINNLNINDRVDGKIIIRDNRKYYYYTGQEAIDRRLDGLDSVVLKPEADREIIETEITRLNNPGVYNPDPNAHITELGVGVKYYTKVITHDIWLWNKIYWWEEVQVPYFVPEYKLVAMANSPIDIEFSGRADSGFININSNNANVFIREDVSNITGAINITGLGLYNMNNLATVTADNLNINVVNGIGSETQAVRIDLQNGLLNANTNNGLINIEEVEGQMNIGLVNTTGDVKLTADGSIYNSNLNTASIKGNNFDLTSISGDIHAGIENNGNLTARANNNITLNQLGGDLLVKRIESVNNGNITLTASGAILDVNENQDIVSKQTLSDIWNEMELTGQAALDSIEAEILVYKQQKKDEYIEQHRIDANTFDDTYDPNYEYKLTDEEQRAFDNSIWTEEELSNSINGAALPAEISQLEIPEIVEETNVLGNDITLTASNGSIGLKKPDTVIEKERFESNSLTDEEKALLQNTDVQKIIINEDNVVILSSDALNIDNNGILTATSTTNIYIESDNDMKINVITAPEDVSLVSLSGSILDASIAENANIDAADIFLTTNNGNIGLTTNYIDVLLPGTLFLTSGNDVYVEGILDDLDIIFYKGALSAKTRNTGNINIVKPNYDLVTENIISLDSLGGNITLQTGNGNITLVDSDINASILSINSDRGGISLLMNFDSYFSALAEGNIYINNASGDLNINSIRSISGNARLVAENSILNGIVDANDVELTSNTGEINTTIESNGILTASAEGTINLTELTDDININTVQSRSGNVSLISDNSIINGVIDAKDINLTANRGRINTSFNSKGKITATANQNIQLVELSNNLDLDSIQSITDNVVLVSEKSILNGVINANNIELTANTGEINTIIDANGQLTATAEQDITLTELTGNMALNTVTSRSGNTTLVADNSILNGTIATNDLTMTANNGEINISTDTNGVLTATANNNIELTELAGDMNIGSILSSTGNVTLIADNSIINGTITGSNIELSATNGQINTNVNFDQTIKAYAENDIILTKLSNDLLDSNIISILSNSGNIEINVPFGNIDLTRPDLQSVNLTLNANTGFINLIMDFESIVNFNARDEINVNKENNNLNITNISSNTGDTSLVADNSILNGVIKGNNINLQATNGEINTTIDTNGKLTATATGNININELIDNMDINLVQSNTGNVRLVANNSILNGVIEANNIDLIATNGEINTTIDSNGILNMFATNNIDIVELLGDINLNLAESTNGNIVINIVDGSINDVNDSNYNIIANNANLTANNITNSLDFNILNSTTIVLTGNASIAGTIGGAINIVSYNLDLSLDSDINISRINVVEEANITSFSNGSILDIDASDGVNIFARNLHLVSSKDIGQKTNYLDIKVDNIVNAEAQDNIFIKEHNDLLLADIIESKAGSAYVESVDAGATIKNISAPDVVSVKANGDIDIEKIDPTSVILSTNSGQGVKVQQGLVSNNVEIHSDYVDVNFEDTTSGDSLNYNITGAEGTFATSVSLNTSSGGGINFNSLLANNAILNNLTPQTLLSLENTQVTDLLSIQSDNVKAINNINLNKLSLLGTNNGFANTVTINNTGDLTITDLKVNFADINTSGDNLIIEKAIITDSGTFSNSTYVVLLENNGQLSATIPDLILKQDGIFNLKLDSSINIDTNADIIAAANELYISGAGERPQINTDMALVTNELNSITDQLSPKKEGTKNGKKEKTLHLLELDNPEMYLDDYYSVYTYYFLELAVNEYNKSIKENDSEDVAMKKAIKILQKANFSASVVEKLLQKEPFNTNDNFVKLFKRFLTLNTVTTGNIN